MKYPVGLFITCMIAFLVACTKDDSVTGPDGMVKSIDSLPMDTQIGMILLEDNNFVVASNGQLVKLDERGNILWRKPMAMISSLRAAVADPGSGFVLFGVPVNAPTPASFFACRYDNDGNLLETKQVNINFPVVYAGNPVTIIRLANGGFAVAMQSSYSWASYLKILDHDFNLVYSKVYQSPAGNDNTLYGYFLVQHICELPGGDIAMSASIGHSDFNTAWLNAATLLLGPDGSVKSYIVMGDSVVNQVSNVVSPCAGGFFAAASRMTGVLSGNGSLVHYYAGTQIAGTMEIQQFNTEGHFIGSRKLTGYSGFGVIKSVRKTLDGGYLLCGTVGNSGSSVSVSMTKMYVCKLDAGLNQVWSKTFPTTYQAIGVDAIPVSDGGCLATGNLKSFDKDYQLLMIRTNANGNY